MLKVKWELIKVIKSNQEVDVSKNVNLYNYFASGNTFGALFEFNTESNSGLPVYSGLDKMRILVNPEALYSINNAGLWNNIYTDSTFTDLSNETNFGYQVPSSGKNAISIILNTEPLKFYYDSSANALVSELVSNTSDLYFKYVEVNGPNNVDLKIKVI